MELLQRYNRKTVFAYIDPPYVMETRKGRLYQTEFEDEQHEQLLNFLSSDFKGKAILSGYQCEMYDDLLSSWYKVQIQANAEAGQSRLETLWCNFEPSGQLSLFG
nr:DNA adenine methylase [Enterococcus innesii]